MKLNEQYDIIPLKIDPDDLEEEIETHIPGHDGWNEYGFAVATEIDWKYGGVVDEALTRRMDNEVLRNLASFAQKSPGLDFSKVQLVEGPKMPVEPKEAARVVGTYRSSKEERGAAWASVTRVHYTRGWYVMAQEIA